MARGDLRAVVCTSTLDLGIDWGDVDLVIQMAAPKGSSRLVQRIGRANHRLDEPSRALLVPASRFEMLECQAAREAVAANAFDWEPIHIGTLDTLAQHVMGVACSEPFDMQVLYDEIAGCGPYRALTWEQFEEVVDFVATGGYALRTYDRFARIVRMPDGRWKVSDGTAWARAVANSVVPRVCNASDVTTSTGAKVSRRDRFWTRVPVTTMSSTCAASSATGSTL